MKSGEADMRSHSQRYNRLFIIKDLITRAGVMLLAKHVHHIYVFLEFVKWSYKNVELLLQSYFSGVEVLLNTTIVTKVKYET